MAPKKKASAKKEAPWEEAGKKKASEKKESNCMTIINNGAEVSLAFGTKAELQQDVETVSLRCSRGQPATVRGVDVEYTFVPNLGVIVSDL